MPARSALKSQLQHTAVPVPQHSVFAVATATAWPISYRISQQSHTTFNLPYQPPSPAGHYYLLLRQSRPSQETSKYKSMGNPIFFGLTAYLTIGYMPVVFDQLCESVIKRRSRSNSGTATGATTATGAAMASDDKKGHVRSCLSHALHASH